VRRCLFRDADEVDIMDVQHVRLKLGDQRTQRQLVVEDLRHNAAPPRQGRQREEQRPQPLPALGANYRPVLHAAVE
jgi:hypothetical protein